MEKDIEEVCLRNNISHLLIASVKVCAFKELLKKNKNSHISELLNQSILKYRKIKEEEDEEEEYENQIEEKEVKEEKEFESHHYCFNNDFEENM